MVNEKDKDGNPFKNGKGFIIKHAQMLNRTNVLKELLLFFLYFPFTVCQICQIILTKRICIMHVNGLLNILPIIAGKVMKTKVLLHLNDTSFPPLLQEVFLRCLIPLVDAVAVTSKPVYEYYFKKTDVYRQIEIYVFPVPVDTSVFKPIKDISKKELLKRSWACL